MENFYIYFFILFGILSIIIIYLNNRLNKLKNILSEREKFELLLENASDGVFILDKSGKIKHFSETTSKMLGYDKNEMKLLYVYDWDKGITKKIFNELIEELSKNNISIERIHTRKDKSTYYAAINASLIEIDSIEYLYASVRDISHEKELLKNIEQEKNKFSSIYNHSLDAILLLNVKKGIFEDVNPKACEMYGYTKDEFLSLTPFDLDVVHDEVKMIQTQQNIIQRGWDRFRTKHKLSSGKIIDVDVSAVSMVLSNQNFLYVVIRDISKKLKIEKLLKEQKLEFESIFNYSRDGIAILGKDTRFLRFNDAFLNMTGYTKEELLEKTSLDLTAVEDREKTAKMISYQYENAKETKYEKTYISKSGERIRLDISLSLLPDKQRVLIVVKDITQLKEIQDQLRLASLGEMIGNIAHQWRQPLSVISTAASTLKLKSEFGIIEQNDLEDFSSNIICQTQYLSKTIDNFRNFIKNEKILEEISIKDVLKSTIELMEASLKNNFIEVNIDCENDINIYGSKNELIEAFLNIISNSKDVLKEKNLDEERFIFISVKDIGKEVEIKIYDNAGGIEESIISKIFEPYFTTKHQSQGTGLGLAISHKIITERHNGFISVYNENFEYKEKKYNGACFIIKLPLV